MTEQQQDFSISNRVAVGLSTNRKEFLASAKLQLERGHAMTAEDARHLVEIVEEVVDARVEEQEQYHAVYEKLRQLRGQCANIVDALDGSDGEGLIKLVRDANPAQLAYRG